MSLGPVGMEYYKGIDRVSMMFRLPTEVVALSVGLLTMIGRGNDLFGYLLSSRNRHVRQNITLPSL